MLKRNTHQHCRTTFACQPIVSLHSGQPIAYELLLRRHLEFGIMDFLDDPNLFVLYLPELTHAMVESIQTESPNATFFVNYTADQVVSSKFLDSLETFRISNLLPSSIAIEVTEQCTISDIPTFVEHLTIARNAGHPIVVDDFGSGFSNLFLIAKIRPHLVKLDGDLVRLATSDTNISNDFKSMVNFIRQLRANVVIEGIESEADLHTAKNTNAQFGQGYYFGKPRPIITTE